MKALRFGILAGIMSLITSGSAPGQELSVEEWREDLQHLARVIEDVHPNPYLFHDRNTVRSAIEELSAAFPGMSNDEIIVGLAGITALLNDGHSSLHIWSAKFPLTEFAPIRLRATPDGWVIVAVAEEFDWALGAIVLTIADRPADEVMAEVARHWSADNESQRMYGAPVALAFGRMLRGLALVDESGVLALSIETTDGTHTDLDLSLITIPPSFAWTQNQFAAPGEGTRSITGMWSDTPLAFSHPRAPYWSEYDAEHELLYIQINQINSSNRPASVNGAEGVVSLPAFLANSLALTKDHATRILVVDLRFNGGGDNFIAREMIQTLQGYPELTQDGRLFVLTGGQTFSAAMNFVSLFEAYSDALFVGEPPGGRPNHFGDARSFPLPNSGLVARVSTLNWQLGVNPWDVRRLMEPDIWAPFDQASLRNGVDPALEAVLAYDESNLLVSRMMAAYEASGVEAAMELFAEEVQPTEPGMWHYRPGVLFDFGFRLFRRGVEFADVAQVFVGAAELYADQPFVLFSIGRSASRLPNWPLAVQMYEGALALWPGNDVIATHLAHARFELEAAGGE